MVDYYTQPGLLRAEFRYDPQGGSRTSVIHLYIEKAKFTPQGNQRASSGDERGTGFDRGHCK